MGSQTPSGFRHSPGHRREDVVVGKNVLPSAGWYANHWSYACLVQVSKTDPEKVA